MMPRRSLAAVRLFAPLAILSLAGCALAGGTTPAPGAPTSAVSSLEPTVPTWTPTVMATPTMASPSSLTPSSSGTLPASGGLGGAVISVPAGTQRQLTEADAASIGTWIRGGFQPAGGATTVEALAQPVLCGATPLPLTLEFTSTTGTLTLGTTQAATSVSSTETLTWTIATDGRLQQTQTVGFSETKDVTVPLSGVRRVDITVSNQGSCAGSAIALITKAVVAG